MSIWHNYSTATAFIRWQIGALVTAICATLVLAIYAVIGFNIIHDYEKSIQRAHVSAQNVVGVMVEFIGQTVLSADGALRDLANDFSSTAILPDRNLLELRKHLRQGLGLVPSAAGFFVLDADGRLLASTNDIDKVGTSFSYREYFQVLRHAPLRGQFIGSPIRDSAGPANGQYVIHVARPLLGPDGEFRGIVAAAIRLEPLARVFELLHLDAEDAVVLYRDDGLLLLCNPFVEEYIGRNFSSLTLFRELLPRAHSGQYVTESTIDGIERISAYERIPDTSLVVFAGLSSRSNLNDWRNHTLSSIFAATLLSIIVCGVSYIAFAILRYWRGENQRHRLRMAVLTDGSARLMQILEAEAVLRAAAPLARQLTDSHQAAVSLTDDSSYRQDIAAVDLSDRYSAWREYQAPTDGSGIYHLVCQSNSPLRMTQEELERHPAWKGFGSENAKHPPMRGWLAVPIVGENGANVGLIQVSDKNDGEFDAEDQALLGQLAQVVSSCVQNIRLLSAVDNNRRLAEIAAFEADKARIESEEHLRSMSDAYVALDNDFRLVAANTKAERILGADFASMQNVHFLNIRPDVKDSALWSECQAAMRDRKPRDLIYHHKPTDRWLDIRLCSHNVGMAIYFRDITRRHLVEEQLRQAQKMDAIGQLTGGVAHDFNNLLTVILGNTDILAEEPELSPYTRRLAELARDAAVKASELTSRLLAFSRRQQLSPEIIDINRCIVAAAPLLQRLLGERVKISLVSPPGLWQAMVDPAHLETALMNLCVNSRDAMPSGGEITILTRNKVIDEPTARMTPGLSAGEYVCLSVSDTGEGMTGETITKAFEPFFTTKEIGKGTGLGLSMVYGFVRQSRGHVAISSELGSGTTVEILFPRHRESDADGKRASGSDDLKPGTNILLVEDDALVRRHTRIILEEAGFCVVETHNADTALHAFRQDSFDIVISDFILSGSINGDGLIRAIRRIRPEQRILLVSGFGDDVIENHDTELKNVLFLHKPFRKSELVKIVREMTSV